MQTWRQNLETKLGDKTPTLPARPSAPIKTGFLAVPTSSAAGLVPTLGEAPSSPFTNNRKIGAFSLISGFTFTCDWTVKAMCVHIPERTSLIWFAQVTWGGCEDVISWWGSQREGSRS